MKLGQINKDMSLFKSEYMELSANKNISESPATEIPESSEMPEKGDTIRTSKMQMEGKVERVGQNRAGYDEVFFRIADGRLMKTPVSNVTVVEKLADDEMEEAITFAPGSYPDVDHMPGAVHKNGVLPAKSSGNVKSFDDYADWKKNADHINSVVHDDNSEIISNSSSETYGPENGKVFAKWNKQTNTGKILMPTNEGMMGGINRAAPAVDVSYEKVLDEVTSKYRMDELSIGKLQAYQQKVKSPERMRLASLSQLNRDVEGNRRAQGKIATKSGQQIPDRSKFREEGSNTDSKVAELKKWAEDNYSNGADTFVETYGDEEYALMLDDNNGDVAETIEFMKIMADVWQEKQADADYYSRGEMDEAYDLNSFTGVLNRQHAEKPVAKKKTVNVPYNGWLIRYRPPAKPGEKTVWQVMDKSDTIKKAGEATTDKDAVRDAQEWINAGGGEGQTSSNKVTIDFNVNFAREFAPEGDTFYAKIEKYGAGTALMVSTTQHEGYKRSHIRNQKNKITGTTTKLPMIPMSASEANSAGLVANGRYTLGGKEDMGDDTMLFPLEYQGKTQSKTDAVRLNKPGLTVATERDTVGEAIDPWHGYTPDDKKANSLSKAPKTTMQGSGDLPFDQMVKDTINTHGLKWAFDYYVRKNGLPPRQFQIFAGLTVKPKNKSPVADKESWLQKLRGKLPFEE